MKSIVAPLLAAIALALVGAGFWMAGHAERRIADVHLELATLQYRSAGADGEAAAQAMDLERRVPVVGPQAVADVRDVTATAKYWQGDHAAIAPQKDATGNVTESDPVILMLSANAAFRGSQGAADRGDVARRLDAATKSYAAVVKATSGQLDAAYN